MSRPPRVLVLEDNPSMLKAMSDALEDQGYEVLAVGNSAAAIDLARRQAFDLVVTDIRMEGLDGLEALEQVKQYQPQVNSMVVTGYSSEAESLRAIRLGAGDYLQKPFALADFTQRVERLLEKRPGAALSVQLAGLGWQLALNLLPAEQRQRLLEAGEASRGRAGEQGLDEEAWSQVGMAQAAESLGLPLSGLPANLAGGGGRSAGALLSLGRALEAAEDLDAAEAVYAEVEEGLEGVLAGLALARLARSRAHLGQAVGRAEAALGRAVGLGAWRAVLDGSFLLQELGQSADNWLRQAAEGLTRHGDLAAAAQAHLAAGNHLASALGVLLQPQYAGELASAAPLLAGLLEMEESPELLARALSALVRESPLEATRLIDSGRLSVKARLRLLEALAGEGQAMEGLLRQLATDSEKEIQSRALQALAHLGPSSPPFLRIYALGTMAVYRGQEKIPEPAWKTQKNRFLLAYLALAGERAVAEERAAAEFWPDSAAQQKNLTGALSVLRLCLRPSHWQGELEYVLRAPGQIALNRSLPRWHDVEELDSALREAQRCRSAGLWQQALRWALRAAGLYRGQYLEDCYLDWVTPVRSRLESALSETLWETARACEEQPESLELLQKLLEVDPCHQDAYGQQMRTQLRRSRPDLAIKAFERCERMLRRELEAEPSLALVELWQKARLAL